MFFEKLTKFMGQEYVFIFTVASFLIAVIALSVSYFKANNKKIKKWIIGIIVSITIVCVFSAICYIVYTTSDDSEDKSVSSGSNSREDVSTDSTLSIMSTDGEETLSTGDGSSPDTTSTSESNPPTEIILYADNQYGKWGYVDQFRKERIPHIYEWADDFIDGYAAVCKNSSCGFISSTGEVVIPFTYVSAWSFIDGLAPVFNGEKWGFIDKHGNVKIPFKFANIYRTYEGSNQVYTDEKNNVINYAYEINYAQSLESGASTSVNSTHSISQPTCKPSSTKAIPIRDDLQRDVSATIDNSELHITINKSQAEQRNKNNEFPFRWGVHLESNKANDYVIELELCIGSDGSVIETNACVCIMTSPTRMEDVQSDLTQLYAYLDNDKYVLSCNIANNYIPLDELCINTLFNY